MELGPLMLTTTLIIKLRKGSIIKNIQMMTGMKSLYNDILRIYWIFCWVLLYFRQIIMIF